MSKFPVEPRSVAEVMRSRAKEKFGKPEPSPHIPHPELLRRAKSNPPRDPEPTVSSFADWVFRLDNGGSNLDDALKRLAEIGEIEMRDRILRELDEQTPKQKARLRRIKTYRAAMAKTANRVHEKAGWKKEYDGTVDSIMETKTITALELNGEPLAARPDLVFRNEIGDVVVIELKTWKLRLLGKQQKLPPPFGWPNLKAQLWCYGLIKWPDAPNVILEGRVGVWDSMFGLGRIRFVEPWLSTDPRVHKECLELFEAFGGRYVG